MREKPWRKAALGDLISGRVIKPDFSLVSVAAFRSSISPKSTGDGDFACHRARPVRKLPVHIDSGGFGDDDDDMKLIQKWAGQAGVDAASVVGL